MPKEINLVVMQLDKADCNKGITVFLRVKQVDKEYLREELDKAGYKDWNMGNWSVHKGVFAVRQYVTRRQPGNRIERLDGGIEWTKKMN